MIVCLILPVEVVSGELGRIEYAGHSIFSLEEGTVEAWLKFEFDPAEVTEKVWLPKGAFFLFEIPQEKGDLGGSFSITVALKHVGRHSKTGSVCNFRIGLVIDGKQVPHPVFFDCTNWGKNKWHHLAVTWESGKELAVYVDGKQIKLSESGKRIFPYSIVRDIPQTAKIILGTPIPWYSPNLLVIDEVRISSIARKPEDLGFYKPSLLPDPYTLFLENFENIENNKTRPFLSNIILPETYQIKGGKITEGKTGKGFSCTAE